MLVQRGQYRGAVGVNSVGRGATYHVSISHGARGGEAKGEESTILHVMQYNLNFKSNANLPKKTLLYILVCKCQKSPICCRI